MLLPITPGQTATASGSSPRGTTSLQPNSPAIPATLMQGGLQFTVLSDVLAGVFDVTVAGATGTAGWMDVRPRVDAPVNGRHDGEPA